MGWLPIVKVQHPTQERKRGPVLYQSKMHRYFFDLLDGDDLINDEEGSELPDSEAVRAQVIRSILDLMRHDAQRIICNWQRWKIRVRDEQGRVVLTWSFQEAMSQHTAIWRNGPHNGHGRKIVSLLF